MIDNVIKYETSIFEKAVKALDYILIQCPE
jgi:hypothetical protein